MPNFGLLIIWMCFNAGFAPLTGRRYFQMGIVTLPRFSAAGVRT